MTIRWQFTAKDTALTVSFTALYVVFGFLKISPIIGLPGQAITAAAIMAPIMGILLGPEIGALSTFTGGLIGFFLGSFSPPSFASGIFAASCAGLTYNRKRVVSILTYASLLLLLVFYPAVGAAWLYPEVMWFQIIGLIILVSPLQSIATKNLDKNSKLLYSFFITSLTSTLAGQIAGSFTLEVLTADPEVWKGTWQLITFLYPVERTIIALAAALIGTPLINVLRRADMMPLNHTRNKVESRNFLRADFPETLCFAELLFLQPLFRG
jgi:hypothetical protein